MSKAIKEGKQFKGGQNKFPITSSPLRSHKD